MDTRESASAAVGADDIHAQVSEYYGRMLQTNDDLRTDACCCSTTPPPKFVRDALMNIDDEVMATFYGCGSPIPVALEGATVLDLGCGSGRDVYVASQLVGPAGRVIGIDMTPEQLDIARRHEASQMRRFGFAESNVEFLQGYIEDLEALGIEDESVDVVISNCVVNLSPFKERIFEEVFRVLKPGGELYFSDVFSDRRVDPELYNDPILRGECLAGALYTQDFRRMLADLGVRASYDVSVEELHVGDFQIATKLGCIGFFSRTVRAIKSDRLEDREEDYGQTAVYLGTIPENKRYFDLSEQVRLVRGKPVAISGNMAVMLADSRYAPHFTVQGRSDHIGAYDFDRAQRALAIGSGRMPVDLELLEQLSGDLGIEPFCERVHDKDILRTAKRLTTMQVNIGYACNLSCTHCYLECGPTCTQMMDRETMEACLAAFASGGYETMDITGGSPEMNPELEWFIGEAAKLGKVIVRSNLAILESPKFQHFAQVYADNHVNVVSSIPYMTEEGFDAQRGDSVFERCMKGLKRLNALGYGTDPDLQLDVAYNVSGPFLPPDQGELSDFYHLELERTQGVAFNGLFAFNNFALGRFAQLLARQGKLEYYLELLAENYNAAAAPRVMCRTQVNVDYDGRLYDCECNHVLGLPIEGDPTIFDIADAPLGVRAIKTNPICYSCAAGSGSSCGGSLIDKYGK